MLIKRRGGGARDIYSEPTFTDCFLIYHLGGISTNPYSGLAGGLSP